MRKTRLAAPVVAWLACFGCAAEHERPGYEYMPDMARSPAYGSFAPNPVTRDGKTLQAPVAGTIARGFLPFRYGATPEEAGRAGVELTNPVAPTAATLAEGRRLYETFCLVCHGERGRGDGPLVPKIPNPPSYTSQRVREMPAGRLFHVITRGSGRMAPYASQVPAEDRWKIVHYVQSLQREGP
jgi:mono/diheme cytochrome c family protein